MWTIDGGRGEGGGQILRTGLALSLVTGEALQVTRIRAGRERPGLLRQHLTAARAAAELCGGALHGAELGSTELRFTPGAVRGGAYTFAVGSAGSATLVLQTVLPALALAKEPSSLVLEGGTHNPAAPPYPFLARAFAPHLRTLRVGLELQLERPGFFPAGGGRFTARVAPTAGFPAFPLQERGAHLRTEIVALLSGIPRAVGERELGAMRRRPALQGAALRVEEVRSPAGPGNALTIELGFEHGTELVTHFGERGVRAEQIAEGAAEEVEALLAAEVPIGEHLADQLLPYLALGAGGSFLTVQPSSHTSTQAALLTELLGRAIRLERVTERAWRCEVAPG